MANFMQIPKLKCLVHFVDGDILRCCRQKLFKSTKTCSSLEDVIVTGKALLHATQEPVDSSEDSETNKDILLETYDEIESNAESSSEETSDSARLDSPIKISTQTKSLYRNYTTHAYRQTYRYSENCTIGPIGKPIDTQKIYLEVVLYYCSSAIHQVYIRPKPVDRASGGKASQSFVLQLCVFINLINLIAETYPNIKMPGSREKCSSTKSLENKLLLCDPDGVLQPDEANNIGSALEDFQSQTKCLCDICDPESGIKAYVAIANKPGAPKFLVDALASIVSVFKKFCKFPISSVCLKDVNVRVANTNHITSGFHVRRDSRRNFSQNGRQYKKNMVNWQLQRWVTYLLGAKKFLSSSLLETDGVRPMFSTCTSIKEIQRGQQKVNKESDPLDHNALIGGVVGSVLFVLFVVLLFVFFKYANMGETKLKSIKKIYDPEAPKPVYRVVSTDEQPEVDSTNAKPEVVSNGSESRPGTTPLEFSTSNTSDRCAVNRDASRMIVYDTSLERDSLHSEYVTSEKKNKLWRGGDREGKKFQQFNEI
ncbi:hypothetical protein GQR58_015211 [Nymphon striatum]|nr:hypothetical protein GQR58_015211 [Nymphon striatum]